MGGFDLAGSLRRIRRLADLSQRELAQRAGVSKSALAAAEAGSRDLTVVRLARLADLAGLRVALLDADGHEVPAMSPEGPRDAGHRRLPAHLDTFHSDEVASHWEHLPGRRRPWFTFALDRDSRDRTRALHGTPDDHQVPQPGDSPEERAEARRQQRRRQADEERARGVAAARERRRTAGLPVFDDDWTCTCPPACDELDDRSGPPLHAPECPCRCDLS